MINDTKQKARIACRTGANAKNNQKIFCFFAIDTLKKVLLNRSVSLLQKSVTFATASSIKDNSIILFFEKKKPPKYILEVFKNI
jgi:hypothetical protein